MKKFIFFLLFLLPVFGFAQAQFNADDLIGGWKVIDNGGKMSTGSVVYQFKSNGGFKLTTDVFDCVGSYSQRGTKIVVKCTDDQGDEDQFSLNIESVNYETLVIIYEGSRLVLKKI